RTGTKRPNTTSIRKTRPESSPARHAEVCEVAARPFANPEPNRPVSAVAQLVDDEARFGAIVHVDAHLWPVDADANVKPLIAIGLRDHGAFIRARVVGSQLLP